MADTSASASSCPSATASSVKNHYHVFINHRGADVKKTFASHLYRHLFSGHGLRVFLDKHELKVGEHFPSEIKDVIRTASVHVAIFSPGYAESEWCLHELLLMLESNAPIIPVFYHVEPADLRRTQSEQRIYSKGLRKLESRHDSISIQKWRDALSLLADKSGLDLKETCNGDEGELVEKIAQWVLKKVKRPGLILTTRYPIGLNEKVESFENKVLKNQQSRKALVVGIVGMGGAGKTTLAVELFNRKSSNYDKSYFLHDVRAGKSSLPSLQTKLLKGLFQLDRPVDNIHEGMGTLTEFLSTSHSKLIVLDDVDDKGQVKALLPDVKSVISSSTSFVLITCRDIGVLRGSGVEESSIYHLDGLNPQYSLQLFSLHAFSQPHPPPEFKDRVDKFLEVCDGLPLSLEVFGALLHDVKDMSLWDAHLDRLRKTLHSDIKERLQISYEALSPEDKEIFLDIACFFIGENRDMAIRIWDGSDWQGSLGFRNLQNRCLVQVDSENRIKMHDHLIDLGRANAEKSASRHCLWPPTENIHDLLQKTSIRDEVRGIRMRPSDCNDNADLTLPSEFIDCDDEYRSFSRYKMKKLQLLDLEGGLLDRVLKRVHAPDLIWLRWIKYPWSSLPSWIPMKKLRVLEVQGNKLETLWESESQAPSELRALKIRDAPLPKFPESIGKLKHLQQIYVNLRKGGINVETLPEEFCNLQSLMTLELLNCCEMKSLPELFGNLTNLEHIDLTGCCKLERLPNSFGNLIRLKYLKLSKCSNLTISSETLGNILTLEYINLSYCSKIEEMPPQIALQRSLGKLYCMGTAFTELPRAIGDLKELEVLYLENHSLKELPHSLGDLKNLKQLTLHCSQLKCLPVSFGVLNQLIELRLRCPITELPFKGRVDSSSDKGMFPRLQYIFLEDARVSEVSFDEGVCPNLQYLMVHKCRQINVGTLPNTLRKLELYQCRLFMSIDLRGLAKLEMLHITECRVLKSIWGLEELTKLRVVEILNLNNHFEKISELPSFEDLRLLERFRACYCDLRSIQGLEQLTKLRELDVSRCSKLEVLPGVEYLRSLEKLKACYCRNLRSIHVSEQLTKLWELDVSGCSKLEVLPGVEHLRSLENLKASHCDSLRSIQVSEQLTKLRELDVSGCSELEVLPGVEHLRSLENLKASGCDSLRSIQVSEQLTKLRELDVSRCSKLKVLPGVEHLRSLEKLKAYACGNLRSIQLSGQLTKLRELNVSGCSKLEVLPGVEHLRSLEYLIASYCYSLRSIQVSEQLTKLRVLDVSRCSNLEVLPGVEHLRSLENLKASDCDSLRSIQVSEQLTKLRELDVSRCSNLDVQPGVEHLRSLEKLKASDCGNLRSIQLSGQLTKLRELDVSGCSKLEVLPGVEHLRSLENLKASACDNLRSIQVSEQLTKLRELDVSECSKLEVLPGVEHLRSLVKLKATACHSLKNLLGLEQLTQLRELDVTGCYKLKELKGVEQCIWLKRLNVSGCDTLQLSEEAEQLRQRLTELEEAEQLEAEQWRQRLTQLMEAEQLRQRLTELEEAEQLEAEQLRQRLTELEEAGLSQWLMESWRKQSS